MCRVQDYRIHVATVHAARRKALGGQLGLVIKRVLKRHSCPCRNKPRLQGDGRTKCVLAYLRPECQSQYVDVLSAQAAKKRLQAIDLAVGLPLIDLVGKCDQVLRNPAACRTIDQKVWINRCTMPADADAG